MLYCPYCAKCLLRMMLESFCAHHKTTDRHTCQQSNKQASVLATLMHCIQPKEGPLESRQHSPLPLFQARPLWWQGQYCESESIKSLVSAASTPCCIVLPGSLSVHCHQCSNPFSHDTSVTHSVRFHSALCHGKHTPYVIPSVMQRVWHHSLQQIT